MGNPEKVNYIEFPSRDLTLTKQFFAEVFGWEFVDYGDEYAAFSHAGIDGGTFRSDAVARTDSGSALIVFYSESLEGTQGKIEAAGGVVVRPVFSFPGGRRFHFTEPSGSEFAVWSDQV